MHHDLDATGNRIQEDTIHATGPTVKRSVWRDNYDEGNLVSVLGERTLGDKPITGGTTIVSLSLGVSSDSAGKVQSMTYPSGAIVAYTYDAKGQIATVSGKPSSTATQVTLASSIAYLPFGPRTGWTFGNGRVMTNTFDRNYDIDQTGDSVTSDGLYEDYTLDAAGNITTINERNGAVVRTYEYDGLDRLLAQKNSGVTEDAFTYDDTGNRLSRTVSGTTTSYGYGTGTHRLTSVGTLTRDYDANGNMTAIHNGASVLGFNYNDRNRLETLGFGATDRTYRYNGKGERVGRYITATPASNRVFFYDEAGHLLGEYTTAGARVSEYVWMDDTLVAVYSTNDGSTYQYIETDYLGTPRAAVKPTSNSIVWWRWDAAPKPFGDNFADSNPDGNGIIYNLPIRYPGQYFDGLAWINYNYYRDYDASVGRYIQSDLVGQAGGLGTYSFSTQNPLRYTDPFGLNPVAIGAFWGCVAAGMTGVVIDNIPCIYRQLKAGATIGGCLQACKPTRCQLAKSAANGCAMGLLFGATAAKAASKLAGGSIKELFPPLAAGVGGEVIQQIIGTVFNFDPCKAFGVEDKPNNWVPFGDNVLPAMRRNP